MSMMFCDDCGNLVDTDDDPEGFYVPQRPDKFICESCREEYPEVPFDEKTLDAKIEEFTNKYGASNEA